MFEKKHGNSHNLCHFFTPFPHLQRSANDMPQQLLIFCQTEACGLCKGSLAKLYPFYTREKKGNMEPMLFSFLGLWGHCQVQFSSVLLRCSISSGFQWTRWFPEFFDFGKIGGFGSIIKKKQPSYLWSVIKRLYEIVIFREWIPWSLHDASIFLQN